MEPLSPETQRIIKKAQNWTFLEDSMLLQWMQQISQNLEQRANNTSEMLQQLDASVKRTGTALENVSNSLTALQYTQFVENRVHDDDDFDDSKVAARKDTTAASNAPQSSAEMLQQFLQNNLKMLNTCHEKYAVDFDDSDDESTNNNCIYQPKNPYNDRPLPHIYGSKLWKDNWHVGLSDGANDYSGEESDAFSESSTSTENNGSADTNSVTNMSSNTSLTNDKYPTKLAVQSASSVLHGLPTFPPNEERVQMPHGQQIAAGSDDSSSVHSAAINQRPFVVNDLFAHLQDTPPQSVSASSAMGSSGEFQQTSKSQSSYSSENVPTRQQRADDAMEQQLPPQPVQSQSVATVPVKRKPVNLFDDEDFNSFMNEIVDKVQAKPKSSNASVERADEPTVTPIAAPRHAVNIFDSATTVQSVPQPIPTTREQPIEVPKRKPVNLFDSSPESSPPKSNIISNTTVSETINTSKPLQTEHDRRDAIKAYTAPKSLFDDEDDEDDDDFLNMFSRKKANAQSQSTTTVKTLLFDDDMDISVESRSIPSHQQTSTDKNPAPVAQKPIALFSDESDADDENERSLFGASNTAKNTITTTENVAKNNSNIFADTEDKSSSIFDTNSEVTRDKINVKRTEDKRVRKLNLFDDEDDERNEIDDLFASSKPTLAKTPAPKTQPLIAERIESNAPTASAETVSSSAKSVVKAVDVKESTALTTESSHDEKMTIEQDEPANVDAKSISKEDLVESSVQSEKTTSLFEENDLLEHSDDTTTSTADVSKLPANVTDVSVNPESAQPTTSTPEMPTNNRKIAIEDSGIAESDSTGPPISFDQSSSDKDDQTESQSKTTATVVNNIPNVAGPSAFMNMFSDEPPEDYDFIQTLDNSDNNQVVSDSKTNDRNDSLENVFDEPELPELPSNNDKADRQPPASSDYGGLRLFSDIPPDDDDDGDRDNDVDNGNNIFGSTKYAPQESVKSLQHVFYDDFNETIEAIQQSDANKIPRHSLFNDEPPSDNDDDFIVATTTATKKRTTDKIAAPKTTEVNNTINDKRLGQSAGKDEADKITAITTPIMAEEQRVQPPAENATRFKGVSSKLPKVNINVQALLPNAGGGRPPNFKKSISLEDSTAPTRKTNSLEEQQTSREIVSSRANLISSISIDSKQKSNENLLIGLCKNRVRAPPKRKPSTRHGRKENYRKSLLLDPDLIISENQLSAAPTVEPIYATTAPKVAIPDKDKETPTSDLNSIANQTNQEEEIVAEITKTTATTTTSSSSSKSEDFTKLFPEDNDNFIEDLKQMPSVKSGSNSDSLFSNTKENTFESDNSIKQLSSTSSDTKVQEDNINSTTKSNETHPVPADALPSGSKIAFEQTISQQPATITQPQVTDISAAPTKISSTANTAIAQSNRDIPPPSVPTATSQLFGDSDDSDIDDLFGGKPVKSSVQRNIDGKNIPATSKTSEVKSKLFADDDEDKNETDFDDLFNKKAPAKAVSNKPPMQTPQTASVPVVADSGKRAALLFESDNDDNDDDDFLSALKSSKSEQAKKSAKAESSKTLFSDEDSNDDDDLFGVGKPKTKFARNTSKTSVPTMKSSVAPSISTAKTASNAATQQPSVSIADNPLADLL